MSVRTVRLRTGRLLVCGILNLFLVHTATAQTVTTFAGSGTYGYGGDGNPATDPSVRFQSPKGVAVGPDGSLFIADPTNNRVRRINPQGIISTYAGTGTSGNAGDLGPVSSALLSSPEGLAFDAVGNFYIAQSPAGSSRIRKVAASNGVITTIAGGGTGLGDGGQATAAGLSSSVAITLFSEPGDPDGPEPDWLYIADRGNLRVREVNLKTGIITTLAGTGVAGSSGDGGPANLAKLTSPSSVWVDPTGTWVYIGDTGGTVPSIRRVHRQTRVIDSLLGGSNGDGYPARVARLLPNKIVYNSLTGALLITDGTPNHRIRQMDSAGTMSTIAGTGVAGSSGDGGSALQAQLNNPAGIAAHSTNGTIYISDALNNRIRKIEGGNITTIGGSGAFGYAGNNVSATDPSVRLANPFGLAVKSSDGAVFFADSSNNRVRKISGGIITDFAGTGSTGYNPAHENVPAATVTLNQPNDVVLSPDQSWLYVVDTWNCRIRRINLSTNLISTYAGGLEPCGSAVQGLRDGFAATAANLNFPNAIAFDAAGNLYISDRGSVRVRKVDAATNIISTIAGNGLSGTSGDGGPANLARLTSPVGLAVVAGSLYISDTSGRIRRVTAGPNGVFEPTDIIDTPIGGDLGDGLPAIVAMGQAHGLLQDGGKHLFLADAVTHRVRRIDVGSNGVLDPTDIITTVAGTGIAGYTDAGGAPLSAQFNGPVGLALSPAGNLYISDTLNSRVRQITGLALPIAGGPPQVPTAPPNLRIVP